VVRPYALNANPLRIQRNVSNYALWPLRWTGRGYVYLWACGHEDAMPHVCPKGPNRGTLFEAPDLRLIRPAWERAASFMDRVGIHKDATADEAFAVAQRRVFGRTVA